MARKRVISPEIWTSEDFLHLSFKGRLLYISLMNHANDQGMFKWSLLTIKASCFPADNITKEEIQDQLNIMLKRKMLVANVDKTLLRFKAWDTYQRVPKPAPNKYEFVEGVSNHSDTTTEPLLERSDTSMVRVQPKEDKEDKIKEDKIREDKESLHQIEKAFDGYYDSYLTGRKKNKPLALKHWNKLTIEERDKAIEQLPHHVKYWQAQIANGSMTINHVPHPSSWLSAKSFNDSLDTLQITAPKIQSGKESFNTTYHDNMVKQTQKHLEYVNKMKENRASNDEIKEALKRRVRS